MKFRLLEIYKKYSNSYKNWFSVLLALYLQKKIIKVKLKNGSVKSWTFDCVYEYTDMRHDAKQIENLKIADIYTNGVIQKKDIIEFDYHNKVVRFSCFGSNGAIPEVFFAEDYRYLNPSGETVIDIGANIGDTAIYFALNGASKVIALEPYINSYNCAINNIILNNLKDTIMLLNAGYGNDSQVLVDPQSNANGSSILIPSKTGVSVKIYSLRTLLNEYKIEEAILKMDCEGCEYNLLNEDNNVLRKFKRIELEFHYGYKNIENKLKEAGFSIKILKIQKSGGNDHSLKVMALNNKDYTFGILYAERN
jgi:FkbM family methyltransferase